MNYSNYVYETQINDKTFLYHSLFQTMVEKGLDEESLRKGMFLAGQEREALYKRIYDREKRLKFFYVATWECSLRCPFCFVLKELEKKDYAKTDPDQLAIFLTNYFDRYTDTEKIAVSYLGGEPLMERGFENCKTMQSVTADFAKRKGLKLETTITTNGTITLDEDRLNFLKEIDMIAVSVDGDQLSHDLQRKVYRKDLLNGESPYIKTLRAIRSIVKAGMKDRITINSALSDDIYNDPARMKEYVLTMLALGVDSKHLHIGTIVPTECRPKNTENYNAYLNSGFVFPKPCCVFQHMSFFTLHGNALHGNYYEMKKSQFGTLASTLEEIEDRYKQYIANTMPVLSDETCMSCPVIGFCWGGCNHSKVLKEQPSKSCNQKLLELNVRKSAEAGTIKEFAEKNKHVVITKKVSELV